MSGLVRTRLLRLRIAARSRARRVAVVDRRADLLVQPEARAAPAPGPGPAPWSGTGTARARVRSALRTSSVGSWKHSDLPDAVPVVIDRRAVERGVAARRPGVSRGGRCRRRASASRTVGPSSSGIGTSRGGARLVACRRARGARPRGRSPAAPPTARSRCVGRRPRPVWIGRPATRRATVAPAMRCLYVDLDGTLLGPARRCCAAPTAASHARRCARWRRASGPTSRSCSTPGRRQQSVFEAPALIGQSSYIFELGLRAGARRRARVADRRAGARPTSAARSTTRSRRSGAPALLLERFAGRLEYHTPWRVGRDVSHLFRGRGRPRRGRGRARPSRLGLAAAGRQRRRSTPRRAVAGAARRPRLPPDPRRGVEGARRRAPHAGARLRARGLHRGRRLARGHGRRGGRADVLAGRQRAGARPDARARVGRTRRACGSPPRATAPASTRPSSRRSRSSGSRRGRRPPARALRRPRSASVTAQPRRSTSCAAKVLALEVRCAHPLVEHHGPLPRVVRAIRHDDDLRHLVLLLGLNQGSGSRLTFPISAVVNIPWTFGEDDASRGLWEPEKTIAASLGTATFPRHRGDQAFPGQMSADVTAGDQTSADLTSGIKRLRT